MIRLTKWSLGGYRLAEFTRLLGRAGLVLGEHSDEVQVLLGQTSQLGRQTRAVDARTCRPARRTSASADLHDVAGDRRTAVRVGRVPRQSDATGVRVS